METKKPIPFTILKVQLKQLVKQYDQTGKGVIFTRDVMTLIDRFEASKDVVLLSEDKKKAILPYTMTNPDLEMTPDDILSLLKLVSACPQLSTSTPNQPISDNKIALKLHKSTPWKKRKSLSDTPKEQEKIKEINDDIEDDQYSTQDLARYYRRSLALTQRLKSSEKNLASMTRDNEDRIIQLQTRVDDMNQEVVQQKKEIQEYKGKEQKSLEQISALEHHISQIRRSETDQKQVYISIKSLFDEKCNETQELQVLLKEKEADLVKTECRLNEFHQEVQLLAAERKRLIKLQSDLELELEISAKAHLQLAEQKSENEKLKEIIDALKTDLDEALLLTNDNDILNGIERRQSNASMMTLETELDNEEKLKTVQDEKNYYKSIATEAKEDLDRVQNQLEYLKKALNNENKSLVHELTGLKLKYNDNPTIIDIQPPEDLWSRSRLSHRTSNKKKNRMVHDYHESIGSNPFINAPLIIHSQPQLRVMNNKDDKIITNTVTFALYTVLVYFFGIVTSTFLMESQGDLSSALVANAVSGEPKSKVWEIVFYWLHKLYSEM